MRTCAALLAGWTLVACHATEEPRPTTAETREQILGSNALSSNALSSNALSSNALSSNALSSNALSSNALSSNALSSNALSSNALRPDGMTEGAVSRQFLKYLYSCAMPVGASMHLVIGGNDYGTYEGAVGLAPEWGEEGGSCDWHCQRWVTACLLARTNFWGVPVKISLRGPHPALATTDDERTRYPLREGTYFGNLFDKDKGLLPTLHACAGPGSNLPQLTNRFCSGSVGPCNIDVTLDCLSPRARPLGRPSDPGRELPTRYACERQDPNDGSMLDCWTEGVSIYGDDPSGDFFPEAITVALQAPVAICGDGVCTGDESAASCPFDCTTGWARGFPGTLNTAFGFDALPGGDLYALVITDGDVDLGGGTIKTLPGEESLLLGRFDARGRFLSARRFGYGLIDNVSSADEDVPGIVRHVIADKSGNIYMAAQIIGTFWFGDRSVSWSDPQVGTVIVKLGSGGDVAWLQTMVGALTSLALRPNGTPLVGVRFFDLSTGPGPGATTDKLFGFAADGTPEPPIVLDTGMAGDVTKLLAVDADGTAIVSHRTFGPPDLFRFHPDTLARDPFDAQVSSGDMTSAAIAPNGDVVVVARVDNVMSGASVPHLFRFDRTGHIVWSKALGSAVPGEASPPVALPVRVVMDAAGDIAVVGLVETAIDMENDALVAQKGGKISAAPIFVAKYSGTGTKRWVKGVAGSGFNFATTASLLDDGSVLVAGGFSNSGVFDGWILENAFGGGIGLSLNSFLVKMPDR